jgi:hypothetical protein
MRANASPPQAAEQTNQPHVHRIGARAAGMLGVVDPRHGPERGFC